MEGINDHAGTGGRSRILYVGSYGEASEPTLHVCSFDEETGTLALVQQLAGVEHASYLAVRPGGRVLYAVSETSETSGRPGGSAAAFAIDPPTGKLAPLNGRPLTHGAHPCYISTDREGRAALVANYSGGSVALLPIGEDGRLKEAAAVVRHEGELGPNKGRQESPHPHCIVPHPEGGYAYVPDLGTDSIVIYRFDPAGLTLTKHGECAIHAGAGPRHLVFHPRLPVAYVINELDSTVTWLRADADSGKLEAGPAVSALPDGFAGESYAADIHLSPCGRFLYASNRGHDSIAVFAADQKDGTLAVIGHVPCGGRTPRNFALSPDGRWLLAASQDSGVVTVFAVDAESGNLKPNGSTLRLPKPVCVRFYEETAS